MCLNKMSRTSSRNIDPHHQKYSSIFHCTHEELFYPCVHQTHIECLLRKSSFFFVTSDHRTTLGLNTSLCSLILDFLTGKSQMVRMRNNTSSPLTLNTGAPQGCVLSPLLYTHDYTATHSSNVIVKFADHNGDRPDHRQR